MEIHSSEVRPSKHFKMCKRFMKRYRCLRDKNLNNINRNISTNRCLFSQYAKVLHSKYKKNESERRRRIMIKVKSEQYQKDNEKYNDYPKQNFRTVISKNKETRMRIKEFHLYTRHKCQMCGCLTHDVYIFWGSILCEVCYFNPIYIQYFMYTNFSSFIKIVMKDNSYKDDNFPMMDENGLVEDYDQNIITKNLADDSIFKGVSMQDIGFKEVSCQKDWEYLFNTDIVQNDSENCINQTPELNYYISDHSPDFSSSSEDLVDNSDLVSQLCTSTKDYSISVKEDNTTTDEIENECSPPQHLQSNNQSDWTNFSDHTNIHTFDHCPSFFDEFIEEVSEFINDSCFENE